eukprot:12386581-Ditylum_brightwellii.AAC.1
MATTQTNQSKKAVDGIWGTYGIQIKEGGYLSFDTGIVSNHRLLWIKISPSYTFGHSEPAMHHPIARNLRLDSHRGVRVYNRTSSIFLKGHNVEERLDKLNTKATFPPTAEQHSEYEALDKLRMQARRKGAR